MTIKESSELTAFKQSLEVKSTKAFLELRGETWATGSFTVELTDDEVKKLIEALNDYIKQGVM